MFLYDVHALRQCLLPVKDLLMHINHDLRNRLGLFRVDELLEKAEIHRLVLRHECIFPQHLQFDPVTAHPRIPYRPPLIRIELHKIRYRFFPGIVCGDPARFLRDIDGNVGVHLHNHVRHMKKFSLTTGDKHDGNTLIVTDAPHLLKERSDRLAVAGDHHLHQRIPDHKICRAGVLIDKEQTGAVCEGFDDICSLRRASARIFRIKQFCVLPVRKVADERRNICSPNAPPILRPDLKGGRIRDHVLPSVTGHMVINAEFQCAEQGRLPMISSADNESDAASYTHTGDALSTRQLNCHGHR